MNFKNKFFLMVFLALGFMSVSSAVSLAPTNFTVNGNETKDYCSGHLVFNWTAAANSSMYEMVIIVNATSLVPGAIMGIPDSPTGYTFYNTTEANYSFVIMSIDNLGNQQPDMQTVYNFYVDSTPPRIALPRYINATYANSKGVPLNIYLNDSLSGVNNSFCIVGINGTNISYKALSGWCNNTVPLTNLTDGNYTINVWANDSVGNIALNNSFVVDLDTKEPSASASCTPVSVYAGEKVSCSCSGSDSGSGIASKTAGSTPSISTPGDYSYSCNVTDRAGNSEVSTVFYTVKNPPSADSPAAPVVKEYNSEKSFVFDDLSPGKTASLENFTESSGLKSISITTNQTFKEANINVKSYSKEPSQISIKASGKIYSYIEFNTNLGESFGESTFTLQVNKSWVLDNKLNKTDVSLLKFNNETSSWDKVNTTFSGENSNYFFYNATPNHFSYYAIGGLQEATRKTTPESKNESLSVSQNSTPVKSESTTNALSSSQNNSWRIYALVVLILIAGIVFALRKFSKKE